MEVTSCEAGQLITKKNDGVCAQDLSIGFKGDSYMKYKPLSQVKNIADIQMAFRPISRSGVILSNKASGRNRNNDFIFIILKRGRVIFSYDLGKGPAKIVSDLQVEMNQWNQLQVHREGVNGYLVLNGRRVTGSSATGASQLNLDTDMYLGGGVQGVSEKYANLLGTRAGFFGSIKNLIINGVYYDLGYPGQAIAQLNVVQNSSFDPCMMTPCEHGGTCSVDGDKIQCDCPNGFLGDRCEIRANVPYFQGGAIDGSYMEISLELIIARKDEFAAIFDIRPEQASGLIMYSESSKDDDFISVAMIGGYVEFRFNLGQGATVISTDFTLQLEQWHHVEIIREGLQGTLIVDFKHTFTAVAAGEWVNLDLEQSKVYLGGATKILEDRIFQRTGTRNSFKGCIRDVESEYEDLRERPLDLTFSEKEDVTRVFKNVKKCGCKDLECQNGGRCLSRFNDFRCECKLGFTGPQCGTESCGNGTVVDLGFALDGSNSIDANEYRLTKDFVKDIIRMFYISESGTHVGLLEYAVRASIRVGFDYFYNADELLEYVEELKQSSGAATNIGIGLEKTLELFSNKYAMRDKVPKVFVFFTDGTNTDGEDLSVFTRQLEEKGIKTLAIGVGSDTNPDELTTIASGSKDNVFRIEEFEELKLVIQKLITALCPR